MFGDLSVRWLALNRGKDAVEVDIKRASDRAELLELVRDADVFLHNWAPGKAEQLGLGAEVMAQANPGLVYAYTSGWGGPSEGLPPGTDFMVQAHTGLTAPKPDGTGTTVASLMTALDVLGGFLGAQAVTAALVRREESGGGVAVESSLRSAARLLTSGRGTRNARIDRTEQGWVAAEPPEGVPHPITTDLANLEHDPRLDGLLSRTGDGLLTVGSPWRVS
jgi:crotonobetainyl-CoA:carnitine CoA-transferase CaiB-like acyl-CoA transferase